MLKCLHLEVEADADPLALYQTAVDALSLGGPTALLETRDAELDARRSQAPSSDLRHVMMLRCALRVEGTAHGIRVRALTETGKALMAPLRTAFRCIEEDPNRLLLQSPVSSSAPDEAQRLREPSMLDPLRVLLKTHPDSEASVRLLALFAHEIMGNFEPEADLPEGIGADYVAFVPELAVELYRGRARFARLTELTELEAARLDLKTATELCESAGPLAHEPPAAPVDVKVDMDTREYEAAVESAKEHIRSGDAYQVVVSRCFTAPCPDPRATYARLRRDCPSPYGFLVEDCARTLLGASPETAVRVQDGEVCVAPIAGTRPRPTRNERIDPDLDARLEAELRLDAKEVAEHLMLVDLARNDIARVAEGLPRVERLLSVARFSRVMHLVSEVYGTLQGDLDALHVLRACSNPGTLTGAPKIRATQILSSLEKSPRGLYGGSIALFRSPTDMDSAIIIRSAVVENGIAKVRAGAGVVAESDPASEARETERKAANVLHALGGDPS